MGSDCQLHKRQTDLREPHPGIGELAAGFGLRLLHPVWIRQIASRLLRSGVDFSVDCVGDRRLGLSGIDEMKRIRELKHRENRRNYSRTLCVESI